MVHSLADGVGAMGDLHQFLLEFGKEAALKTETDRRLIEAAAGYLAAESEVGFIYSAWAQTALPHKRLPDNQLWEVQTDHVTLVVEPGVRKTEGQPAFRVGVPYGSRARLILLYLQSEALRTGCREVALGRSLRVWLGRLGIPIGGKSMKEVREQAERISLCRMSFHINKAGRYGLLNQNLVDSALFEEGVGALLEVAVLSQGFFDQLRRHPVPIEEAAIRQLANNSLALDVYCWLAYRLHALKVPVPISWKALHGQFGRSVARLDSFRTHFRETLKLALAVYPDAQVDEDARGVVLKPSRPPVLPPVGECGLYLEGRAERPESHSLRNPRRNKLR